MKKFFALLIICFSTFSYSLEIPLAEVISEPEGNIVHKFFVELDDNFDVQALVRKTDETTQRLDLEKIVEGIVLIEKDGFEVITLTCPTCDSVHGGEINLKYLYSGISKKFRDFKMELLRDRDSWGLFSIPDRIKIKRLKLVSRIFLGQVIGIKKILVNP
ncbi:MAG: hypothetical protein DRQ88_10290 [Epsilonproteobacteria bacterium]|nr:MAG: hypothetical protein DRQ89_03020 [Campylobacterota bacterium]RLA64868.1 MAG: hypothetical protein DRQ88_10290 [Campylobacterota bacterium]